MRISCLFAAVLLVNLFAAAPRAADADIGTGDVADLVFSTVERRLIEEFFGLYTYPELGDPYAADQYSPDRRHGGGLPPGLARRGALPPGLQMQLDRRGTLPPGLARQALPLELVEQLPPPLYGTERVIVGNDVLLVEAATGLILDILFDLVRR